MHQREGRKVREVDGLLAAERTAAAAVDDLVVVVVVAAVAVEGDDDRRTAVLCLAVFPAAFACRRLRRVGHDGSLVDDLHAGTPVFSAPPAAALPAVAGALPPRSLPPPPSVSAAPPALLLAALLPPLPPPAAAAARPPARVLVVAVQVAALVFPLPAGFLPVVRVAGGERGQGDGGGERGDLGAAVFPAGIRRAGRQRRAGLHAGVERRGRV